MLALGLVLFLFHRFEDLDAFGVLPRGRVQAVTSERGVVVGLGAGDRVVVGGDHQPLDLVRTRCSGHTGEFEHSDYFLGGNCVELVNDIDGWGGMRERGMLGVVPLVGKRTLLSL